MHPRNQHNSNYNFDLLTKHHPKLSAFVKKSPTGRKTIDFANPHAVKSLNSALLACYYNISQWDIPEGYLCPPIPGRADYIHHIADLLAESRNGEIPEGKSIKGIDIGTGANLIYPLIGSHSYGWKFIGSDIDRTSIKSANVIIQANKGLSKFVDVRHQTDSSMIFNGVILPNEQYAFTLCNPPFHSSAKAAVEGSQRKSQNLQRNQQKRTGKVTQNAKGKLNFGGQSNELWCKGGELAFVRKMVKESVHYKTQVEWFTTLVSKKDNLKPILNDLKQLSCEKVKTINMQQGQKTSRFIAWQF